MGRSLRNVVRPASISLAAFVLMTVSVARGQTPATPPSQTQGHVATAINPSPGNAATSNAPVFTDYRGIRIGMAVDDVRAKFNRIKKADSQDYLAFSERETAQIYYDKSGKVTAISIDYFGGDSNAPAPDAVLGITIQAKPDGSMYQMKRYSKAGYWVSYNRTAGDKPVITITMQKM